MISNRQCERFLLPRSPHLDIPPVGFHLLEWGDSFWLIVSFSPCCLKPVSSNFVPVICKCFGEFFSWLGHQSKHVRICKFWMPFCSRLFRRPRSSPQTKPFKGHRTLAKKPCPKSLDPSPPDAFLQPPPPSPTPVSQWGHEFRPDYLKLAVLKANFPTVPLLALTATATPRVTEEVELALGVKWVEQGSDGAPHLGRGGYKWHNWHLFSIDLVFCIFSNRFVFFKFLIFFFK